MKWQTLALILGGVVLVGMAVSLLRKTPAFSGDEEAMMSKLRPILDTLLLTEEDLSSLGEYVSCPGARVYRTVYYDYRSQEGSLEVDSIREGPSEPDPGAAAHSLSSFCEYETGGVVSPLLTLPRDKEDLLFEKRVETALAQHREEDLERLIESNSDDVRSGEVIIDARWIDAPGLGHTRYGWARTVAAPLTGERFELFEIEFTHGVVEAYLYVRLPSGPTAEDDALSLARMLEDRIVAKLQSLRAEVQAH